MMESQTTLAVIVLYRVAADASQAFCSLRSLMAADPQAAVHARRALLQAEAARRQRARVGEVDAGGGEES